MRPTLSDKDTKRLKVEGWRSIYCTKINQYKIRVAKLPSEKNSLRQEIPLEIKRNTFYND